MNSVISLQRDTIRRLRARLERYQMLCLALAVGMAALIFHKKSFHS